MKIHGQCFKAYPEFPILPFDPAVFGFTVDRSDPAALRQCPCFAAGEYLLWWNWTRPEERELYAPLSRFFITKGLPDDLDAPVLFQADTLPDLVRHLLTTEYAKPRPVIDTPPSEDEAAQLLDALAAAGFLQRPLGSSILSAVREDHPGDMARIGATTYLAAIKLQYGSSFKELVATALSNAVRLLPAVE